MVVFIACPDHGTADKTSGKRDWIQIGVEAYAYIRGIVGLFVGDDRFIGEAAHRVADIVGGIDIGPPDPLPFPMIVEKGSDVFY